MSSDDLIGLVGRRLERRSLLKKVALGAMGVTLGLLGQSRQAAALFNTYCCSTCYQPSANCQANCPSCSWCWSCLHSDGFYYQCCECHYVGDSCPNGCTNVQCTWIVRVGQRPA